MSHLFEPWQIGSLQLANRIVIAPMCQYSSEDGCANDWHMIHLGTLAISGAGLLIIEATAVSAEGRITPGDLGLYSDADEAALARVLASIRSHSPIAVAIQLGHAGRKASSHAPWDGGQQIPPGSPTGWHAVAPSAVPHSEHEVSPVALDRGGMNQVREDFVAAAQRAVRLGLQGIELHAAHGYLLHQFLSPIANKRNDDWGGDLEGRMRFPLEVFDAVRAAVPADFPVWVRVSATDWVSGGWDIESTIVFARALQARGSPVIHVSTGGVSPHQSIVLGPGYQVPFAAKIKMVTGMPTIAVGLITEAGQAESILAEGQADAIALARAILFDPRWPWHAAAALGGHVSAPRQYWRSQPREYKDLFELATHGQR